MTDALPSTCGDCAHCVPRLLPSAGYDIVEGRVCDPMGLPLMRPRSTVPPSWCPLRVPSEARRLRLSLETASTERLHERCAEALGWPLEWVRGYEPIVLREKVMRVDAKLAQALGIAARAAKGGR